MITMHPGMTTMPEPAQDVRAQLEAVANPASAKHAAFLANGTPVPKTPPGMLRVQRPEGTLVTNSPAHAAAFKALPDLTQDAMASLLGYLETKQQAAARGNPVVVQGRTPGGAVAHESAASSQGLLGAAVNAAAAVPGGTVHVPSASGRA